ncbi:MAG: ABC transporter permease [Chloroflexi bacterium]|nr:ABC transporter permease [Chloroflexota bacterium]
MNTGAFRRRMLAIARKEFLHILRDPWTLVIVLAMPVIMLTVFGLAISFDVKNLPLIVYDNSHSVTSQKLVDAFTAGKNFRLYGYARDYAQVRNALDSGRAKVAVVFPRDLESEIDSGRTAHIQVLLDGSDPNAANLSMGYLSSISGQEALRMLEERSSAAGIPSSMLKPSLELIPRFWYNPGLSSANFIVPGLIAIIMMMAAAMLSSMAVVREREKNTLEEIIVSPIKSSEFILGKLIPYGFIAYTDVLIILLVGWSVFHVPVKGSLLLLLIIAPVFLVGALGIGLLVSTVATTQQMAMMLALFISLLPSFILSGFVFPLNGMPYFLQAISYLVPAKYFLVILRGVLLKGVGITAFWPDVAALLVFASAILLVSFKRFKKQL